MEEYKNGLVEFKNGKVIETDQPHGNGRFIEVFFTKF